jgi:hypothetical protein
MALTPYSTDPPVPPTPRDAPVRRRRPQRTRGGTSSGLPNWFQDATDRRDVRRPTIKPGKTMRASAGPPIPTQANVAESAQMPQVALLPEVEDIGVAAALGRQPGVGEPGSLDGMTNRPRRRRLV